MKKFNVLDWVAMILVIIGGLNWGLVGLFDLNLVPLIFRLDALIMLVYVLVGLSALYLLYLAPKLGKK
ncbi:DUF378 domain-containing protein [Candidatus Falkowbacteria bacterium RIFOXYD2_FULL_35_9]|uniref:DUF378 domain-containing protein n=1 Tax=Candidatus Falkowbacteria bacterium RIFOXYC2_FULL_36_12 TaxID=1798002 RepID=A0A1F5T518_9BACT|nr:MAG: DUF378 domain-containing protein [Candidatus Falkowbacteria bacterium RIFOXYC2_FULL_36_12]OGF34201.1 MAG: DUF378 domain-containing protein [Candidatus Falkowbacteria bacterium RIFOXYA2_FULL_35_8]OGF47830.1 MAG: DUF378 domain-containing protein [Candidatus Falkowbacteria bacterium RIFOXYD2_FULL_35_9]